MLEVTGSVFTCHQCFKYGICHIRPVDHITVSTTPNFPSGPPLYHMSASPLIQTRIKWTKTKCAILTLEMAWIIFTISPACNRTLVYRFINILLGKFPAPLGY
jgi:hypothetical protein